jgi:hypothetical protein
LRQNVSFKYLVIYSQFTVFLCLVIVSLHLAWEANNAVT